MECAESAVESAASGAARARAPRGGWPPRDPPGDARRRCEKTYERISRGYKSRTSHRTLSKCADAPQRVLTSANRADPRIPYRSIRNENLARPFHGTHYMHCDTPASLPWVLLRRVTLNCAGAAPPRARARRAGPISAPPFLNLIFVLRPFYGWVGISEGVLRFGPRARAAARVAGGVRDRRWGGGG